MLKMHLAFATEALTIHEIVIGSMVFTKNRNLTSESSAMYAHSPDMLTANNSSKKKKTKLLLLGIHGRAHNLGSANSILTACSSNAV